MIEAGLILARFLHYAAAMALFGVSLFPLYAYTSGADPQPARISQWYAKFLFAAALATFLSALLWLAFVTANMAGTLNAAIDGEALRSVLIDTAFGKVWTARLGLSGVLVVLTLLAAARAKGYQAKWLNTFMSAIALALLAGTGHTMNSQGMASVVHIASDGAHLLAAGAWLGGLLSLGYVLINTKVAEADPVLKRFSGMGYVAVAVLVGSGLLNSWFLVGSVSNLLATPYGQLLMLKLCLFAGMLLLAALNRFWLVPALATSPSGAEVAMARLGRHVLGEQTLGMLVILAVSVLGTIEPAIGH